MILKSGKLYRTEHYLILFPGNISASAAGNRFKPNTAAWDQISWDNDSRHAEEASIWWSSALNCKVRWVSPSMPLLFLGQKSDERSQRHHFQFLCEDFTGWMVGNGWLENKFREYR